MSSQSWNAIPEARRKALAGRLRHSRDDSSDEDVDLETIDEAIAKPYRSSSSDKDGKASSGSRGHGGGAKNKSPSNSFQEQDVDHDDLVKEHDRKLERLETRIEKLLTLNENLSDRNQRLEDLLVQVAERVGISHGLGKRT